MSCIFDNKYWALGRVTRNEFTEYSKLEKYMGTEGKYTEIIVDINQVSSIGSLLLSKQEVSREQVWSLREDHPNQPNQVTSNYTSNKYRQSHQQLLRSNWALISIGLQILVKNQLCKEHCGKTMAAIYVCLILANIFMVSSPIAIIATQLARIKN